MAVYQSKISFFLRICEVQPTHKSIMRMESYQLWQLWPLCKFYQSITFLDNWRCHETVLLWHYSCTEQVLLHRPTPRWLRYIFWVLFAVTFCFCGWLTQSCGQCQLAWSYRSLLFAIATRYSPFLRDKLSHCSSESYRQYPDLHPLQHWACVSSMTSRLAVSFCCFLYFWYV